MEFMFGSGSSLPALEKKKKKSKKGGKKKDKKKDACKNTEKDQEDGSFASKYVSSDDDSLGKDCHSREEERIPLHTYIVLGLEGLVKETRFTREEIQRMYRGFKQECPKGLLDEETFLAILNMLFPGGDSTLYCSRIFKILDCKSTGKITFEEFVIGLSSCLHGDNENKLRWAFRVYDNEQKGYLMKEELFLILTYIYNLIGVRIHDNENEKLMEHTDGLFELLDIDKDGRISEEEFVNGCLKNVDMMDVLSESCNHDELHHDGVSDTESIRSFCHLTNSRIKRKTKSRSRWKLTQA